MAGERDPSVAVEQLNEAAGTERRRDVLERIWFVLSMLYAGLRIALADAFLAEYGLNIVVFAVIELLSTPIYAIGTSRGVRAMMDRRRSLGLRWVMLAIAGFVAPDAYVIIAARHVPKSVYIAVLAWVVLGTVLGIRRMRRQIKRMAAR